MVHRLSRCHPSREMVMIKRFYQFAASVFFAAAICSSLGLYGTPAYADDGEGESFCDLKDSGTGGNHNYSCTSNCNPCNLGSNNGAEQCSGCP